MSQLHLDLCVSLTTQGTCEKEENALLAGIVGGCLVHQWHAQDVERPSLVQIWKGQTGQDLPDSSIRTSLLCPWRVWPQVLQWGGFRWEEDWDGGGGWEVCVCVLNEGCAGWTGVVKWQVEL